MQEIEFTKEDEYCIRNFGYNTVGDYENLKQLEDEEHLIVEELEYRLQQKENIIKEVREKVKEFCWDYEYETYSNMTSQEVKELVEILDKGE